MIDIKSDGNALYKELKAAFEPYKDLLTIYYKDSIKQGLLTINLSGNRPIQAVSEDNERFFTIDGRFDNFSLTTSPTLVPRISDSYKKYFKWKGKGPMPATERQLLKELVTKVHQSGKKVRFWAMPNKIAVWKVFVETGVDWINVDKLEDFRLFMSR